MNAFEKLQANPDQLKTWLEQCRFDDPDLAIRNLESLSNSIADPACFDRVLKHIGDCLPVLPAPDLALNSVERLCQAGSRVADRLQDLSQDEQNFSGLLCLVAHSSYFADLLRKEENFDFLFADNEASLSTSLANEAWEKLKPKSEFASAQREVRIFYQQRVLQIAWGDLVLGRQIDIVAQQLSSLAAAVCDASIKWCRNRLSQKIGEPFSPHPDQPCRYVILALGKLGGNELNYSSDIDLIAMFEHVGAIKNAALNSNQEYFGRITRDLVKLIGETTADGSILRVDLRLRPNGSAGPVCQSQSAMLQYYDLHGRTWERQAMIKARPIAGDLSLGKEFLKQMQPWIFRQTLSRTDITGIRFLKRKIERRSQESGEDRTNVKTGYGGIRDVEFVIQFMQLLNSWDMPELRSANTLNAINHLQLADCLMHDEAFMLSKNYRWLRTLEHRLQMMNNQQTHRLPEQRNELVYVARRMGFDHADPRLTLEAFRRNLRDVTHQNRAILEHLLYGAFGTSQVISGDDIDVSREAELILDSDPDSETVEAIMTQWGFSEPIHQFRILMELAQETTQFISSRRCKHFFASIAQPLLEKISQTPDPNRTLTSLASVSDSLGARGALWELFSYIPETLELYVRLCASWDYLADILRSNPGMIDELLDALQLESLPNRKSLDETVRELTRGSTDFGLALSSFKNTQHMRIGVRDILGQDDIRQTHETLSDVAEACLEVVLEHEFGILWDKQSSGDEFSATRAPFLILGMGKLGGAEPNYHSDLDVIFLYDDDSDFQSKIDEPRSSFFIKLATAITHRIGSQTQRPRLFEIDSRLRPLGSKGSLAVSFSEFARYFDTDIAQLWERQALCKARPVAGNPQLADKVMDYVRGVLGSTYTQEVPQEIWDMRLTLQQGAADLNLKRGAGGTVDIEFVVQMLRLKFAPEHPQILVAGTLAAIDELETHSILDTARAKFLRSSYQFLRSVESRLRLMNTNTRHDLPTDEKQLARLAYLMNFESAEKLSQSVAQCRHNVRQLAIELFGAATL